MRSHPKVPPWIFNTVTEVNLRESEKLNTIQETLITQTCLRTYKKGKERTQGKTPPIYSRKKWFT